MPRRLDSSSASIINFRRESVSAMRSFHENIQYVEAAGVGRVPRVRGPVEDHQSQAGYRRPIFFDDKSEVAPVGEPGFEPRTKTARHGGEIRFGTTHFRNISSRCLTIVFRSVGLRIASFCLSYCRGTKFESIP